MLKCPRCRSAEVAKIVFGRPPGAGEIAGGNIIRPASPGWRCLACRHEFGSAYERVKPLRRPPTT